MRTNLDKWNYYKSIIIDKEQEFINSVLPDPQPKILYRISPRGLIFEYIVDKLTYKPNESMYYSGKKPTRDDVQRLKLYSESNIDFQIDKIMICYYRVDGTTKTSSADLWGKIKDDNSITFYKEIADKKSQYLTDQMVLENNLLKNGYIKCAYCCKVVLDSESVTHTIISYANYGKAGKKCKYCSGTCAGRDQMAHEG